MFDDQEYEDLMNICSYLNWRQMCRGRLQEVLIDIRTETNRRGFCAFIALPPESREGSDSTGFVKYDPALALKFEEINKVGQFTPSASTNTTSLSTSKAGSSSTASSKHTLAEDERKLNSFYKKFNPQDYTFPEFKAPKDFVRWSTSFSSKLLLSYEENILDPSYVAPTLANGSGLA